MKKILLLSISIIYSISCLAQLTHTSDFVKINLPNGVYKLNDQQMDSLKSIKSSIPNLRETYPPYLYKAGYILLSFFNVNKDSINNNLPRQKIFIDELSSFLKRHGNNTYKSIIEKRGDYNVLTTSQTINGRSKNYFYIQNEAKTLTQAGGMEYPEADAAKAAALLNEIINNVQFTK